ncbi:uncharacterized protein L3040_000735 [Drepanopeziza brunnea f. sp. 'multigermtubi']|uniref:uncharacterized protein n=1 Tax=Drepanopeziza brunnea f. sp. 'multigermtubi' TaxID=698441 RepID=UPI002399ED15|nr:hypothetical protein L3040_000735 [Drepanopeziza brunnea f. sp. 'multigermtubi']
MLATLQKASSAVDRKPKTIYQLDSPFTTPTWPATSPELHETITELLCSLLAPIGHHRREHVAPSKGKRAQKRKRAEEKRAGMIAESPPIPPLPEISQYVVVGLNSLTRHLEALSQKSKPQQQISNPNQDVDVENSPAAQLPPPAQGETTAKPENPAQSKHFSAIFLPTSLSIHPRASILSAHLPALAHTASLAHPSLPATRLVQLPVDSEARLCEALGLPRVSFIGLVEGAPHSKSVVDVVRGGVKEVEVNWLEEAGVAVYKKVRIEAVETFIGAGKEKVAKKTKRVEAGD